MDRDAFTPFKDKAIVIVGGAGFVGSNLARQILKNGPARVAIVDNLLSAERSNVPENPAVTFIEGSITDDAVLAQIGDEFDYAFQLATFHGNQNSMHDPLADHENNTLTSLKFFNHIRDFKDLQKVVYSSAGCTVAQKTFDDAKATTEDDPVSLYMDSPYQISKIIGEFYANYYFHRYQLPVVKARFQNVYGPGEILGAGQWRGTPATVWRNVTPTFVYRALKGMPLTVENGGIATRDFIYAEDIAEGLMRCASAGEPGGVYNLASGVETSILELAERINDLTGNQVGMDYRPKRDWDRSGKRYGSTNKAAEKLGFQPQVTLEDGLRETVEWTQENLALIDSCIARHARWMTAA